MTTSQIKDNVLCRSGNRDELPRTLHTPDSDQQQPYPAHRRNYRDHKSKGLQKRWSVERTDSEWDWICPPFPYACSSERLCPDTAYGILSNQNKHKLIPICRNLISCREFLRRFREDDKAQAIRILYRKDVTVCPCCGGVMSYEVCTGWEHQRSSA